MKREIKTEKKMFLGQMSCYGCLTVKDMQPIVVFVSGHGGRVTSGMSLSAFMVNIWR